jgi:hypothetical protein
VRKTKHHLPAWVRRLQRGRQEFLARSRSAGFKEGRQWIESADENDYAIVCLLEADAEFREVCAEGGSVLEELTIASRHDSAAEALLEVYRDKVRDEGYELDAFWAGFSTGAMSAWNEHRDDVASSEA